MKVPTDHFEQGYADDPDPWGFAWRFPEQRRYDLTVAALPRPRFRRAFEPGCAIGELSRRLATRCDDVVAMDCSPIVVADAAARTATGHIDYRVGSVPDDWPEDAFDLVVLSEIGYYFCPRACAELRDRALDSLEPDGVLLAVHWLGHSRDHLLHGDDVHDVLGAADATRHGGGYRDDGFRLDWWVRA